MLLFRRAWISRWQIKKMIEKIPDKEIDSHLYLTGKTGSGKSSLVLQRVYWQRYKSRKMNDRCIIVLDPHGDMVEKMRKFDLMRKYFDRCVYIDPTISKSHTPTMNPLECRGKESLELDIHANQLMRALEEMLPDAKLTNTMRAVIKPCLHVLLSLHDCTLQDLFDFLNQSEGLWVNHGKRSMIPTYRKFFVEHRNNSLYTKTKQSLSTKIQSLLNSQTFHHMVIGKSTIDLERFVRQGKVILFNLSKGKMGEEVSETLGRFIIAQCKSIALKRAKLPPHLRTPIYLVIDEADSFIKGNSLNVILQETRKFGLHLILITQNIVSGKEQEKLKRNLINNTNVKVIGANGQATLKALSQETGIGLNTLQRLNFHEFRVSFGLKVKHKIKTKLLFGENSSLLLNKGEVISVSHRMIHDTGYYKPIPKNDISPDWIEEFPENWKDKLENKNFPRPKFMD